MKITDFYNFNKKSGKKISMITCYDYSMAFIISQTEIDVVLVGDSLSMCVYGYNSTIYATVEMMIRHTEAVKRGIGDKKLIITDMPFLSTRKGRESAVETAGELIRAGADAIKIENIEGQRDVIEAIIQSGIPVMGHLGITPQYIKHLGSYCRRGKDKDEAEKIINDAKIMQESGCFSIVLECISEKITREITKRLKIPTIGIGSGRFCDGQVIVLNDILGLFPTPPSFAKKYEDLSEKIIKALNRFNRDVKGGEDGDNKGDK